MLQAGEGARHAARANDAKCQRQLGLHFIAAGLQLLGQLFQTQQLGGASIVPLAASCAALAASAVLSLAISERFAASRPGLFGLGTDGGQRFTQGALFSVRLRGPRRRQA